MAVLRDEKQRQTRLRQSDYEEEGSVRSGSSYNGRGRSLSFLGSQDIGLACSPSSGYVPSPPPRSISMDPSMRSSLTSADMDMRMGSPASPGPELRSVSDRYESSQRTGLNPNLPLFASDGSLFKHYFNRPLLSRSSLALSDSSGESSRQFVFPRQPCPIHRPTSPARITTGDFKKVFSERQNARMAQRCTCRNRWVTSCTVLMVFCNSRVVIVVLFLYPVVF